MSLIPHLWLAVGLAQDAPGPAAPLQGDGRAWRPAVHASLGAQWMFWVGDDADLARFDAAPTEAVRMAQSAAELEAVGPGGVAATLRLEEGIFHAGGLEAAEAWVGLLGWEGRLGAWIGRNDLPVTRDRQRENDELVMSQRPVLSRTLWPIHPTGAGAGLAFADKVSVQGGASYTSLNADAPLWWVRADLTPLGSPPERQDQAVQGLCFLLGGGWLAQESESLGDTLLWTADLELRLGPAELSGAWVHHEVARAGQRDQRGEWIATAGSRLFRVGSGDLHMQLRGERLINLLPGEDVRWLPMGRVALRLQEGLVQIYSEALLSWEEGTGLISGQDVIDSGRGIERDNHLVSAGMLVRWGD